MAKRMVFIPSVNFSWLLFVMWCSMYYSWLNFAEVFGIVYSRFCPLCVIPVHGFIVKQRFENGVPSVCGAQSL